MSRGTPRNQIWKTVGEQGPKIEDFLVSVSESAWNDRRCPSRDGLYYDGDDDDEDDDDDDDDNDDDDDDNNSDVAKM